MKRVYFEPVWKIHPAFYKELILNPPEGYEFVIQEGPAENIFKSVSKARFSYWLSNKLYEIAPVNLIKSRLDSFLRKKPKGSELTYSLWHLVFRNEPWVVEVNSASDFVGLDMSQLRKHKQLVEDVLASDYCRKILAATEFTRRQILSNLDGTRFENKIEILPRAVHRKDFTKSYGNDKVRLLFVGSASIAREFEARGGKEVLEAFSILSKKYDDLELVIRSDMPNHIKKKYFKILEHSQVTMIEKTISEEQLEELYESADIFLFPGHYNSWMITPEAMSYELPVITTDVEGQSEQVEDGKTGFIINKYDSGRPLASTESRSEFMRAIRVTDHKVVQQLVEKVSILIENRELRRRMGQAGRWEVEHGRFSIKNRNEKLKRIFDEATG